MCESSRECILTERARVSVLALSHMLNFYEAFVQENVSCAEGIVCAINFNDERY